MSAKPEPYDPIVDPCPYPLEILHHDVVSAQTHAGLRCLGTSHPPTYYFPQSDVAMRHLRLWPQTSMCEWKGRAMYFDVQSDGGRLEAVAWTYPRPQASFLMLRDYIAFYAAAFDTRRWRASCSAARRFLRRLDHFARFRPVQGSGRSPVVASQSAAAWQAAEGGGFVARRFDSAQ